ncbi:MAG: hypothetical protein PGN29_15990 [Gordonia paraffinivorans]
MLVSALGATLVGFALLVLALATGTLWLAVACIVICVLGAVLLLADTLGVRPSLPGRRRHSPASEGEEPGPSSPDDDAPTEQFAQVADDAVVTLGDDDATSAHHGRHERPDSPDVDEDAVGDTDDQTVRPDPPARRGRHGTPD